LSRRKNPDVEIIKAETVGHWEGDVFVLDQEVVIPGSGKHLEPGWKISLEDAVLPPAVTPNDIVEALINSSSVSLGEHEGKPMYAVGVSPSNSHWYWHLAANVCGYTGNVFVFIGRQLYRAAAWLAAH